MQDEPIPVNVPLRLAPWSASEIFIGVLLVWLFWPALAQSTLQAVGFYRWYYGPELVAIAEAESDDSGDRERTLKRMSLWPFALASPFQILTFPLLLAALSGARPSQLGLTTRRFGRNGLYGIAGVLILAPIVFGIYALVRYLYGHWGGVVEKHPLEVIAEQHLFPGEWFLLFLTAMLAAPLLEELTFRGVLQPWLAMRRWGGHAAMLGALALAVRYRWDHLIAAWPQPRALAAAATPALFVLALVPLYCWVWRRSRTPLAPAVFGTSLLFACTHAAIWPTPVPLFVLALGLGILAQRSGSLVGPIVLHSLFNGISCVQLLLAS